MIDAFVKLANPYFFSSETIKIKEDNRKKAFLYIWPNQLSNYLMQSVVAKGAVQMLKNLLLNVVKNSHPGGARFNHAVSGINQRSL